MAFDRRSMLIGGAAVGVGAVLEACKREETAAVTEEAGAAFKPPSDENLSGRGVSQPVLEVLVAVAERILPSEGTGPGAKETGVGDFLQQALADERLAHLGPLLKRGAGFLSRASQAEHKQSRFSVLAADKQDDLLRRLVEKKVRPRDFDGPTFVRVMVALTLEGYLGDPKHGGNRDGAAWDFLHFNPRGRNA